MSERNDVPRPTIPVATPPLPGASAKLRGNGRATLATDRHPVSRAANTSAEDEARERIAALEREARALSATDPQAAALLFHEMGLLWEEPLKNPRNAAVAYQNAYKLAPQLPREHPRRAPPLRRRRQLADGACSSSTPSWAAPRSLATQAALLFEKAQHPRGAPVSRRGRHAPPAQLCLELQARQTSTCSPSSRQLYAARRRLRPRWSRCTGCSPRVAAERRAARPLPHRRGPAAGGAAQAARGRRRAASARPSRWTARTRCCSRP